MRAMVLGLAMVTLLGALLPTARGQTSPWEVVYRLPRPLGARWLGALWASGPDDIHVVGHTAAVHYDGQQWRLVPDHSTSAIFAIAGSGPTDVYAVGSYESAIEQLPARRRHALPRSGGPRDAPRVAVRRSSDRRCVVHMVH